MTQVIQAANVAKAAGKLPGFAQEMVDAIRAPEIDWRAILRRFVDESCRKDFSWSRPNRRFIAAGIYLPGSVPDGLQRLGVLVDTSGSIDMEAHAKFFSELQGAVDDVQPDVVQVVQCDKVVHSSREYGPGEPIDLTVVGRGGTDMNPGLAAFAEHCAAIICFTDCRFPKPPADPGIPVLWARWGGGKAPAFGEVIDL